MTACLLVRDLGFSKIIVPPAPGVLAAYGGLIADVRNDFIQTAFLDLDEASTKTLADMAGQLREGGLDWLRNEQQFAGEARLAFSADMRYRGQSYEIEVQLDSEWLEQRDLEAIANAFHLEHERVYEYADNQADIQLINLRLVVSGTADQPEFKTREPERRAPSPIETTQVYYDGAWRAAEVYRRDQLQPGDFFSGPAIVRQDDCTTCLVEGFDVEVDRHGNIIVSSGG